MTLPPPAVQPDRGDRRFARLRARPRRPALRAARLLASPAHDFTRNPLPLPVPLPAAWPFAAADFAKRLYGPRWCLLRGLRRDAGRADDIPA